MIFKAWKQNTLSSVLYYQAAIQLSRQAISKTCHWQGRAAPVHMYVKVHSETQHYKCQKHSQSVISLTLTVSSCPYSLTNTNTHK